MLRHFAGFTVSILRTIEDLGCLMVLQCGSVLLARLAWIKLRVYVLHSKFLKGGI